MQTESTSKLAAFTICVKLDQMEQQNKVKLIALLFTAGIGMIVFAQFGPDHLFFLRYVGMGLTFPIMLLLYSYKKHRLQQNHNLHDQQAVGMMQQNPPPLQQYPGGPNVHGVPPFVGYSQPASGTVDSGTGQQHSLPGYNTLPFPNQQQGMPGMPQAFPPPPSYDNANRGY